MRANQLVMLGGVLGLLWVGTAPVFGQAPDEEREILKEIKEAYKAPFEVHEDVLKELRKSYQQPTPEREAKIFKELRRLYDLTPDTEQAILTEIRRAYDEQSPVQEERLFREIRRADPLPEGTVPDSVQANQVKKLFQKLDRNGDGLLSPDELPDFLRNDRARWDSNRDGFIDLNEYASYYQGRLRWLSDQVSNGQIDLGLKRGGPVVNTRVEEESRPTVFRAGRLPRGIPDWFVQLDKDGDGQIGLYEWRKGNRPLEEFFKMDRNDDGFVTIDEVMRYLAQQPPERPGTLARRETPPAGTWQGESGNNKRPGGLSKKDIPPDGLTKKEMRPDSLTKKEMQPNGKPRKQ